MVRWFSPGELAQTGLRAALSAVFGAYADKREMESALPHPTKLDYSGEDELWIDYVADVGDAFDPTYSVAYLLAREKLQPDTEELPRGRILVMGGDQVYPSADVESYENKAIGPYRAALPRSGRPSPLLLAVPGNHDWYDGLTAFMRVFCQRRWVGGWSTQQTRSYFSVRLPHGWWLWGIDVQFDTYVDEPQLAYFRSEAEGMQPGDGIILCSAKPSWTRTSRDREAYATLDFFEREVLRPQGARVRLHLAGDAHHYARYRAADGATKLTSGGGGAYLSGTHHLPRTVDVPPPESAARHKSDPVTHELCSVWPSRTESRRLTAGVFALLFKNWSFGWVPAAAYVLLGWAARTVEDEGPWETSLAALGRLASTPWAALSVVALAAALRGFTKSRGLKRWACGTLHLVGHLSALALCVWAARHLVPADEVRGRLSVAGFVAVLAAGGYALGSLVTAAYLWVADRFDCNANEVFAAQHLGAYRNFLRMKVDGTGVTVYPVGLEKPCKEWEWRAKWGDAESAVEPAQGTTPRPQLIEQPFLVTRDPAASG